MLTHTQLALHVPCAQGYQLLRMQPARHVIYASSSQAPTRTQLALHVLSGSSCCTATTLKLALCTLCDPSKQALTQSTVTCRKNSHPNYKTVGRDYYDHSHPEDPHTSPDSVWEHYTRSERQRMCEFPCSVHGGSPALQRITG